MASRTPSFATTLGKALAEVPAELAATVALAQQYARAIDEDPGRLEKLGPLLLKTLEALGLTRAVSAGPPAAGARGGGGEDGGTAAAAALGSLRDRAARRRSA